MKASKALFSVSLLLSFVAGAGFAWNARAVLIHPTGPVLAEPAAAPSAPSEPEAAQTAEVRVIYPSVWTSSAEAAGAEGAGALQTAELQQAAPEPRPEAEIRTAAVAPLAREVDEPVEDAEAGLGGIDLNTASLEELNSLSGGGRIGRAIIRGRPYASVDDLVRKRVLKRSTFNRIRDQVAVR